MTEAAILIAAFAGLSAGLCGVLNALYRRAIKRGKR